MRLSLLAATVAALAGCTSIQSSNLKTSGMSAYIQVSADGTGQSTVNAHLNVDNNATDFVDLSGGDQLVATAAGQTRPMARSTLLGTVSYETTFTGADGEGTPYTVALNRMSDVSAPASTCSMPKPFNITAPAATASLSRANDDIVVTYDAPGTQDSMSWSADGSCIKSNVTGSVAGDIGTFTIAKGSLVPTDASQTGITCSGSVTLTRTRPGQLDSHFGSGGSITAQQVRKVSFNSTP